MLLFFQKVASRTSSCSSTGSSPTTASVDDISEISQFYGQGKSSSISQLIKAKSRNLQKLLIYVNGTTTSLSNLLFLFGEPPIIFVLYSKGLFVVVFALFSL